MKVGEESDERTVIFKILDLLVFVLCSLLFTIRDKNSLLFQLTVRRSDQSQSPFCSISSAADLSAVGAAGGTTSDVISPPALVTMLPADAESKQLEFLDFSSQISVEPQMPDQEADEETTGNAAQYPMTSLLDAEIDNKLMFSPLPSAMSAMSTLKWPLTEAEDALVTRVLHGPSRRRRLPVFTEFCSE